VAGSEVVAVVVVGVTVVVVVVAVVVGFAVVVVVVVVSSVVVVVSSVVVVVLSVGEETDVSCGSDPSGATGVCPQAVSKTAQRGTQRIHRPICFINIPLYKLFLSLIYTGNDTVWSHFWENISA